MLPTSFPPPAPWHLRISLRPVPAPWRICKQPHAIQFYFLTFILSFSSSQVSTVLLANKIGLNRPAIWPYHSIIKDISIWQHFVYIWITDKPLTQPTTSCSTVYHLLNVPRKIKMLCLYLPWRIEEVIAELLTEALQRPFLCLKGKAMRTQLNR